MSGIRRGQHVYKPLIDLPHVMAIVAASLVDGARAWHNLRYITLPLLRPTVLFAIVIPSIYSIRMFAEPNLLFSNNEAPAEFQPIMNQLYENLRSGQFGNAAAAAWLVFIPVVVVASVQFRLLRGDPTEGVAA